MNEKMAAFFKKVAFFIKKRQFLWRKFFQTLDRIEFLCYNSSCIGVGLYFIWDSEDNKIYKVRIWTRKFMFFTSMQDKGEGLNYKK
jgi:hypothetical protein